MRIGESLQETARTLIRQSAEATATARQAAQVWRVEHGEVDLPADLAWAWSAAQDLQGVAESVYSLTISLSDALRRIEA